MMKLVFLPSASLDRLMVEVEGEQVPLRQVGQIGMPNPQMLQINMSSYPQVGWLGTGCTFYGMHDDLFCVCVCVCV